MKLLALVLFAALGLASADDDDKYCFGKDSERSQTRHFTAKTAYQIIKGTKIESQIVVPDCRPTKLWIFHRHGTRLPPKSLIKKGPRLEELRNLIVSNNQVKKTAPDLCAEDVLSLKVWKWNTSITEDKENFLTPQGYEDLKGTARLYQRLFSDIVPREYSSNNFLFRHTNSQRTTESFKAFAEGLFGPVNSAQAEEIPGKDYLLRPFDYCDAWQNQNIKGPDSQSALFHQTQLWNDTMAEVSKRLGFDYVLAEEDIMLMYDMCRYEQAWLVDRVSVWCAAFLKKHVTVFEYDDDLKYLYKAGYGYEENSRVNCRVVQNMISHLNSSSGPAVVTYFAHSVGLQTLITALGMHKDINLPNANNYEAMANRKWQTSIIDPFASNLVAVRYECGSSAYNKEKVMFFLNQYAVDLNWCKVGLCDMTDVLKRYEPIIQANCDEYFCSAGALISNISFLLAFLLAAIIYLIN